MAVMKPLFRLIGERRMARMLVIVSDLAEVELIPLAYRQAGIVPYSDDYHETGESYLLDFVLPQYLKAETPVFFDVGANAGTYTRFLCEKFPRARVYAFEPNIQLFGSLNGNAPRQAQCFNLGLSSERGTGTLYSDRSARDPRSSEHASVYRDVLSDLHRSGDIIGMPFEMDTMDDFCSAHDIPQIDFLKIDTEGHDLAVLQGARRLLAESRIGLIQFEFNDMNVVSRVFLKDFYALLDAYHIYRLHPAGPIPLFEYRPRNEIFVYQNFLAIHRSLAAPVKPR
jgi:FkbM family methyltransferase